MKRLVAAVLVAGALVLGSASPALAHDVLTGSDPKDGASLAEGPGAVTLTFNQPVVHDAYDEITVTGPSGGRWESGGTTVDGRDVTVPLHPLGPAGRYTVGYRILSADGHPVTGKVAFTLTAAGTGKPVAPDEQGAATATGAETSPWWWVADTGALLVIAAVLLAGRAWRRKRRARA